MVPRINVVWRLLGLLFLSGWLGQGTALAGLVHQAAYQGRLETVKRLLTDKQTDINTSDGFGSTPLHHAAMGGKADVVTWLLHNGAKVDARDTGGGTPLILAIQADHVEVAKVLIQAGADVNVHDNLGGSVLAGAAYHGHRDLVELLLDRGAQVNHANTMGLTPLHMATLANAKTIMRILLNRGADANAKDVSGETPLNKQRDEEARQLLMGYGARLVTNQDGTFVEQSSPKGME